MSRTEEGLKRICASNLVAFRMTLTQIGSMAEKSLSEISRSLREGYEKGKQALERNNLEYAQTLLLQVLIQEPGFYDCRAALRAAQFNRAGANKGFFKKMFGAASNSPALVRGQAVLRSNPREALTIAEQVLNEDAHSAMAHRLLADAAIACEFPKTAVLSLEILFKQSEGDPQVARKLAEALAASGQVERAESIFTELVKASPNDPELNQAYKNISAQRTLSEGGYKTISEGQGSYRDILKNEAEAVLLEQESKHQKPTDAADELLAEYLDRLPREPQNIKLRRSIAELYRDRARFDESLAAYAEIATLEGGNDPSLARAITETRIKQYNHRISALEAAEGPDSETVTALKKERDGFMLEDCRQRVEKYPTDLHLRFEFGQLLLAAGQVTQAIQEFQKSQNNPHKRIASMGMLAQCFSRRNMLDLAARTLQNAIKEKPAFDEEKKELIYNLGCILERMGKRDEAMEQFKQIYEVDIGYKEVAAKVDAYYDSGGGAA